MVFTGFSSRGSWSLGGLTKLSMEFLSNSSQVFIGLYSIFPDSFSISFDSVSLFYLFSTCNDSL